MTVIRRWNTAISLVLGYGERGITEHRWNREDLWWMWRRTVRSGRKKW